MAAVISAIGYFLPIFAFLLVFIVAYAILKKSDILGKNEFVMLLISFILASFFIVQTSLVRFIQITSAWASVVIIIPIWVNTPQLAAISLISFQSFVFNGVT